MCRLVLATMDLIICDFHMVGWGLIIFIYFFYFGVSCKLCGRLKVCGVAVATIIIGLDFWVVA